MRLSLILFRTILKRQTEGFVQDFSYIALSSGDNDNPLRIIENVSNSSSSDEEGTGGLPPLKEYIDEDMGLNLKGFERHWKDKTTMP